VISRQPLLHRISNLCTALHDRKSTPQSRIAHLDTLGVHNTVYESAHPTTAVLVVEISDTTLAQDRAIKAGLYARAGIPEYWIVNLPERVVEVYRGPVPMPGQALDHGYRALTRLFPGETLAPRVAPEAAVPVADVLPRAAAGGA
jgi:hypothetical protein